MQSDKIFEFESSISTLPGPTILGPTMPLSTPLPPPPIAPSFLRREIGDSKWWAGVSVLEANPQESECWVAEHYTGYRYVLSRGDKKGEYIKNTYYKNTYVEGSEYVLQWQCPFIVENDFADEEDSTKDTAEKSTRLADPVSARAAYIDLCKASLAEVEKSKSS